jgi:hypothetical protein
VNKALPLRAALRGFRLRQWPQGGDHRGRPNPSRCRGPIRRAHHIGAQLITLAVQLRGDGLHLPQVPQQIRPGNLDLAFIQEATEHAAELAKANLSLHESEERLRMFIEHAPSSLAMLYSRT